MKFLTVLCLALALASPAHAQDKCQAAKVKATGKKMLAKAICQAKALGKGEAVDTACLTKAEEKFNAAITKADEKGPCSGTAVNLEAIVDQCISDSVQEIGSGGASALAQCQADLDSCENDLAGCATGCDAPLACPDPSDGGHQTICGQLYDLEDGSKFAEVGATGTQCSSPTLGGPCSLNFTAYDASDFGANPAAATPLSTGSLYIDDCGRYRLSNVAVPSGPFLTVKVDDFQVTDMGPAGTTNTVTVSTQKQGGAASADIDSWIAAKTTTDAWEISGGPPVSGGLFVPIFYEAISKTSRDLQDGVTFLRSGSPVPLQDNYFVATEAARQNIDAAATATGINGTALVTGATVAEGPAYSGTGGGLSASCIWETHAGASLPNILSVQDFRPKDAVAQTCDR